MSFLKSIQAHFEQIHKQFHKWLDISIKYVHVTFGSPSPYLVRVFQYKYNSDPYLHPQRVRTLSMTPKKVVNLQIFRWPTPTPSKVTGSMNSNIALTITDIFTNWLCFSKDFQATFGRMILRLFSQALSIWSRHSDKWQILCENEKALLRDIFIARCVLSCIFMWNKIQSYGYAFSIYTFKCTVNNVKSISCSEWIFYFHGITFKIVQIVHK